MSSLTIKLARSDEEWIDAQIEAGGYVDSDHYVGELIRRDRERRLEELREQIRLSLQSGVSKRRVGDIIADAERRFRTEG